MSIQSLFNVFTVSGLLLSCAVVLIAAGGAALVVRRFQRWSASPLLAGVAAACVAIIPVFTLLRPGAPIGFAPALLLDWWSTSTWDQFSSDPFGSTQITYNAALFVPAGVTCAVLTRRPWWTLAALSGLSVVVECVQGVTGLGLNDVVDLLTNILGAAVGTGSVAVVRWIRPGRNRRRPSPRYVAAHLVPVVVALAAAAGAATWAADQKQSSVVAELQARFAGTSLADYRQWEQEDLVDGGAGLAKRVFFISPTLRTDGASSAADHRTVRYPTSVFGIRRCVLVRWATTTVVVTAARGGTCSRPMFGSRAAAR